MELIKTSLEVSAIALPGWWLWWLLISRLVRIEPRVFAGEELEMIIVARQLERRDKRIDILDQIRDLPSCPNGSPSDAQLELWRCYKEMEAEDDRLCEQERMQIVEATWWLR